MDSIKVVTLRALPNCDLIHNQYQHLNALLQRSTECLHNREWSTGMCYGQCVQMLQYKVAQFLPKVSQNVSTTILLKKWCFQNSPKGHQTIWLLLIEKLSLTTLKKSPNLVTLVTVKIKAKWHNIYFEQRLKTRNTLNDFLIFEILFESFKFCSRVVVHSLILYDIFQGWNAPASINCFILNRQNIDKFFCLFHDTYLGCSSTKVYKAPSKGRGGGQVVSILAIYSDNLSSNPTEVYSFYSESCSKTTKINKKGPGMAHFLQHHSIGRYHCLIVISLKSETF